MKNFKSVVAMTAAVLALSTFAAPLSAFASDTISDDGGTFSEELSLEINPTFTVTIPADVRFTDLDTSGHATLIAEGATPDSAVCLANGKALQVTVASAHACTMAGTTNGNTDKVGYTISADTMNNTHTTVAATINKNTTNIGTTGAVLATFANKETDAVILTFTPDRNAAVAADIYKDTLTFTVTVVDA